MFPKTKESGKKTTPTISTTSCPTTGAAPCPTKARITGFDTKGISPELLPSRLNF
jgi:hypothetical protein